MKQLSKSHKGTSSQAKTAKISCPVCGNDEDFLEVANGVILTSRYLQNDDGSFILDSDESEIMGEVKLICGDCGADLAPYQQHFLDMLF
ncbi:MAG: hypothetical protein KAS94_14235 [Desulfobulbaceae bacterium]|nr:hypothetical protein [Desulfobulbaceae bacterium]